MSNSNWAHKEDMSPDRNRRNYPYGVDNLALQLGLGLNLPIELICGNFDRPTSHFNGQRGFGSQPRRGNSSGDKANSNEIQQTVDGIPIRKVYITNIGLEVERHDIQVIFSRYGKIMNIYMGVSKNHPSKKFAFVTYEDPRSAACVLRIQKFRVPRQRNMYAVAADSWHQPKEDASGKMNWNCKMNTNQQEESEEDEESSLPVEELIEINEESLNIVNDDCLLHIFSFLPLKEVARIERVCKRWQALSYRMWKCLHKLSFSEPTLPGIKANTSTLAACLRRCGPSLQELHLDVSNHQFDETTLAVVAKHCINLEVLRVSNLEFGHRSLAHLGRCCPKLKQLSLDDCSKFNDQDLMSLLPKCQQLRELDISHSSGLTGTFLATVQSPLVSLQLNNLGCLETNALIKGLERLSESLETLKVNLSGSLHSGQVEKLVSAVPNLTSLSICKMMTGMMHFSTESLVPIGKLKKLNSIDFSENCIVNDNLLAAIVEGCKDLTEVNLSCSGYDGLLTEQGLSMLSRLRQLTHLDISYLENATDNTLKAIIRNPKLQKLVCRGCPEITDEGCVQVVTVCNDLELFDMSGCCNVGEATVYAALASVKMRTNNVPLKLIVGGTDIVEEIKDPEVPLLTLVMEDLSEEHLRPDFIDAMFLPPSDDDDDEEDLDDISFMFNVPYYTSEESSDDDDSHSFLQWILD